MDRRVPAARPPTGLSADELAVVVRRATELDTAPPDSAHELGLSEVQEVLREAGISGAAARQAIEEWRRGELAPPTTPPPPLPEGRLSPVLRVERILASPPADVTAGLDGQLRRQWFTRGRRYGNGGEWIPRAGLFADLRRRFDVRGTLLLHEVSRLRLDLQPGKPGSTLVGISADLAGYRSRLLGGMVVAPAVAGAVTTAIGIPVDADVLLAGLPIGLALAGGGYLGASRALDRRKAQVEEALHILLDRIDTPRHGQ